RSSARKPQVARSLGYRPQRSVRIVIPLPVWRQAIFIVFELIADHERPRLGIRQRRLKALRHLAVHTKDRPMILPCDRYNARNSAYCTMILEQYGVPLAGWRIDNPAL